MPGPARPSVPPILEPFEASLEDLVLATWVEDASVYLQLDSIEYAAADRPISPTDLTTID